MSDVVRVLIVDDDLDIARMLDARLTAGGCLVSTCSHVDEAIAALSGLPYDAVLTDLQLPGPSGLVLGDSVG